MLVKGTTTVREMLTALELTEDALPRSSEWEMDDEVDFSVVADKDELAEEFRQDATELNETLALSGVTEREIFDLSAAIRRGDRVEAELLLDRVFADDARLTEQVQMGRYSRAAA